MRRREDKADVIARSKRDMTIDWASPIPVALASMVVTVLALALARLAALPALQATKAALVWAAVRLNVAQVDVIVMEQRIDAAEAAVRTDMEARFSGTQQRINLLEQRLGAVEAVVRRLPGSPQPSSIG
jgi:hypothetical protein